MIFSTTGTRSVCIYGHMADKNCVKLPKELMHVVLLFPYSNLTEEKKSRTYVYYFIVLKSSDVICNGIYILTPKFKHELPQFYNVYNP